jgi:NAD(P)-dependent dehydrogenase (short-subunit alcohol dehydrogenase family)
MSTGGAIYPDLENKSVLITGGGSGIGEAMLRAFARQKAKIGFLDIKEDISRKLAAELQAAGAKVRFEPCDITDIEALRASIVMIREAHGPITILINNAAHDERHKTEEVTPEYWDLRIAVNLKHQFFAAQAVLPDMKEAGGGSIVNFGSISWMLKQGGLPAYTTAKSAVQGLTRSLARDLGPFNIRVNTVVPGWVMTERQKTLWLTPEGDRKIDEGQCLSQRLLPADIARMVLFLAADDSEMCTNQTYIVDGGWI